ncbi:MAG: molybdopterin molybdenumtransferase MoeA, partial [Moraxella sp.]|nr:molybdopterin molybdenumtransferase MoeA [Moraxella sp.]
MILVNDLKNAITQRATNYANHDNPLSSRQVVNVPLSKSLGKILAADITAPLDLPR